MNLNKKIKMTSHNIRLGKTPGIKYIWKDGETVIAEFTVFDWWDGKNIENLKINPAYRKRGLSYELLDYAVKTLNVNSLAVAKDNHIAKHVYDKYGFKKTDEDSEYYYMSINPSKVLTDKK